MKNEIFLILSIVFVSLEVNLLAEGPFYQRSESLVVVAGQTPGEQGNDVSLIKRLLDSYKRDTTIQTTLGNSMWQYFFDNRLAPLHQTFKNGSFDSAASILRNPGSSELFYGIDNLCGSILPQFSNQTNQKGHAMICLDSLVRFAEAVGAIRLDNPENHHHHLQPMNSWSVDAVLKLIDEALESPITFPNPYPQEHGVLSSRGIISYRVPQALYQAWRIRQLLKGIENPRVLEIGAGVGRTAFYAHQLGIKDYTIVDIPLTAISSGYFIGRSLGEDKVQLSGESLPDAESRVKFITPQEFVNGNEFYDLIINVDSMTEMDPNIALAYWNRIETNTGIFLSINHESNSFTVKNLIDVSKNIERVDRMRYWMRRGYVEEIVRFKSLQTEN